MAIEGTAEEFIIRAPILDGKNGYYRHLMKVVDIRYILCCVLVSIYTFSNNIRTQADWRLYKCKKYESWPMFDLFTSLGTFWQLSYSKTSYTW